MYALITGASSGIGKEYAVCLARDYKRDLILVSNQQEQLQEVADELSADYGVKTVAHYADLAREHAADEVYRFCHDNGYEVDILINNAGMFFWQPLIEAPAAKVHAMLMLHAVTLAEMCRLFAQPMCERRNGYILNMASMTAWMTIPGIQCYNSTKAFVYSFSKSIYNELRPYNVSVTVMTPGAIDTPLYGLDDKTRRRVVRWGISLPPEKFAAIALRRMFQRRKQAMPGWINHVAVPIISHLPDPLIRFAMKRFPQYKNIPMHNL